MKRQVPLVYNQLIRATLLDVENRHSGVFNSAARVKTLNKVERRLEAEGLSFLTKTLPRLGKALDRALSSNEPLTVPRELKCPPGSQLPKLFGELFRCIFDLDGRTLPKPCAKCVQTLRQVLFQFYKLNLPYTVEQELSVIDKFVKTDLALKQVNTERMIEYHAISENPHDKVGTLPSRIHTRAWLGVDRTRILRRARNLIAKVLSSFDPFDIVPGHGPGAVSTKEKLWDKWHWSDIPEELASVYPICEYFYHSMGHVVDRIQEVRRIGSTVTPAQIVLVPKDSRGPRIISEEPLYNQWIQQGIARKLMRHVEQHPLTRCRVNFTDQRPNQIAAERGSIDGRYATLDLNEASDRVSCGLVQLLFPSHLLKVFKACRSKQTRLPNGTCITLEKFAPMGSSLCFPVLALTVWALVNAVIKDADARERVLVYGDDVIVPKAYALDAMNILESVGLKINRDKSCVDGLFRESCGMDAFAGVNVTPTRFRVPPVTSPTPDHYCAWIAYANSLYSKGWVSVYETIVDQLVALYGPIPCREQLNESAPSLIIPNDHCALIRRRVNKKLQRLEYQVRTVRARTETKDIDGWMMLLRWSVNALRGDGLPTALNPDEIADSANRWDIARSMIQMSDPWSGLQAQATLIDTSLLEGCNRSVREYTHRRDIKFSRQWR